MRFKDALWDNSDPTYAPYMSRSKRFYFWKPPAKVREDGYPKTSVRLTGEQGDGLDLQRAAEARELTREMVRHYERGKEKSPEITTWSDLIERFIHDRYSPIRDTKQNTRANYIWCLERWTAAIGHIPIADTDYEAICEMHDAMKAKGRSVAYISRMFNRLRAAARYGKVLRNEHAAHVSSVLSEMRFRTPPKRSVYATRDQIRAMMDLADARGQFAFATGIMIQFECAVRAVDVRGQWLPADPEAGGIVRQVINRKTRSSHYVRWQDGLTWDMVADDFSSFTKVISKTEAKMPEPIRFDLTDLPELRARLRLLANGGRVGPVILSERLGQPYTLHGWSQAWRRLRNDLGIPEEVKAMDSRAGALTEAQSLGASLLDLQHAGQHMDSKTTQRYLRGRDESVSRVVKLRSSR